MTDVRMPRRGVSAGAANGRGEQLLPGGGAPSIRSRAGCGVESLFATFNADHSLDSTAPSCAGD